VTVAAVRNLETLPIPELNMKTILLLTCAITLITTTGCFFPERGGDHWHDHDGDHWHDRGEIIVPHSEVAARAPEVIVAPPLIEARAPEVVVR